MDQSFPRSYPTPRNTQASIHPSQNQLKPRPMFESIVRLSRLQPTHPSRPVANNASTRLASSCNLVRPVLLPIGITGIVVVPVLRKKEYVFNRDHHRGAQAGVFVLADERVVGPYESDLEAPRRGALLESDRSWDSGRCSLSGPFGTSASWPDRLLLASSHLCGRMREDSWLLAASRPRRRFPGPRN